MRNSITRLGVTWSETVAYSPELRAAATIDPVSGELRRARSEVRTAAEVHARRDPRPTAVVRWERSREEDGVTIITFEAAVALRRVEDAAEGDLVTAPPRYAKERPGSRIRVGAWWFTVYREGLLRREAEAAITAHAAAEALD